MIEFVLLVIYFAFFVYSMCQVKVKVEKKSLKRERVDDEIDVLDEPMAKKTCLQVMRVAPFITSESIQPNIGQNPNTIFESDDDDSDDMSDTTVDAVEYFNRDPRLRPRVVDVSFGTETISSESSEEGDYNMNEDTSSSSDSSESTGSVPPLDGWPDDEVPFRPVFTPYPYGKLLFVYIFCVCFYV